MKLSEELCALLPWADGWESASLSEEDNEDGEWIDVHHSSDEEQQQVVSSMCLLPHIQVNVDIASDYLASYLQVAAHN